MSRGFLKIRGGVFIMLNFPTFQQYSPVYQNNYNNFGSNYDSLSNYSNITNIFNNNAFAYPAPMFQQQQQDNSAGFLQQLVMILMSTLLNRQNYEDQTTISDTSIWGDPHYNAKGKDGKTDINFTHNGKTGDTYNVFKGDGYEVDGQYGLAGNDINKILDAKIRAGADLIDYNVNGQTSINGKALEDGSTITLNDGTKVTKQGANMIMETRDGNSKISFKNNDGICLDPTGKFGGLGGILGTAIDQNRNLSEEEANKFDLSYA